jgi:hypothetical protein
MAKVNSTLKGFKDCISELLNKLVNQGFKLAALRKKFVQFYNSKLNIWGKFGVDIYDEFCRSSIIDLISKIQISLSCPPIYQDKKY